MTDSIFSKIIRGEIPAQKLYEDDAVIAILDINPLSEGHCLVIPKEPAETMGELSDDAAAGIGRVLPRLCRALRRVTGCPGINVLQNDGADAGQEVMHVHVHLIPRFPDRDAASGGGLTKFWKPTKGDPEAMAELGRQIARLV
ncbi:MAG: HIT family protein [Planctomycetota bacterium]